MYGKGEKWCITKGSFANYRYDANKKYPTFYLVKDKTLSSSNPKSFFVIMVGNDGTYKASDRTNNDLGGRGGQSEWKKWENWGFVEKHFPSVTGLESYFKYRPIPKKELDSRGMHTLEDWYYSKDVNKKNQRLIDALRQDGNYPFKTANGSYVTWTRVIKNVLARPELKPVTDLFVKSTYENPEIFLQNYEYFTPAQQKSIIANTNNPQHPTGITADELIKQYESDNISYQAVLDLVKANKIKPTDSTHLYLTGRDNIVVLNIKDDNVVVNVIDKGGMDRKKLTAKTEHYLTDDPYLTKINLNILAKAVEDNQLSPKVVEKAIAGEAEGKDLVKVGDTNYVIQYGDSSMSVIDTSGKSVEKELPEEVVTKIASTVKSDTAKKTSFLKSIVDGNPAPIPSAAYNKIITSLSPEERTYQQGGNSYYFSAQPKGIIGFSSNRNPDSPTFGIEEYGYEGGRRGPHRYNQDPPNNEIEAATKDALENFLPPLTTQGATYFFDRTIGWGRNSNYIIRNVRDIKLTPDNNYVLIPKDDSIWLVNKADKDLSKKFNFSSRRLVNLRMSQANYDQVLGRQAQPRQQPAARATAPPAAAGALPATSQGGNTDLLALLADRGITTQGIPDQVLNRLRQGGQPRAVGADTINRFLNIGTVRGYQLQGRASSMFIITLTDSNRGIATVHMQPGNIHGVLSSRGWTRAANSGDVPTRVAQALQESLNNNKMTNKLSLIRKIAEQVLRENQPAWAPKPGERDREVADPDTDTEEQPLIAPGHPGHDDDNVPENEPMKAKNTQGNKEARATIIKKLKAGM